MRRYLVVANQTLLGDPLLGRIRTCMAEGPCQFYLVVPASHAPGHSLQTESRDRAFATQRLQAGLEQFRALGIDVDGEVGDGRPMDAIRDAMLHAAPFDEIILSTLPPGLSRWLRQDLPHRIARTFELPMSTVTVRAAA
ncbi:MAG: hypothetical protein V7605_2410 [Acidimicrobiaceae bacterium]